MSDVLPAPAQESPPPLEGVTAPAATAPPPAVSTTSTSLLPSPVHARKVSEEETVPLIALTLAPDKVAVEPDPTTPAPYEVSTPPPVVSAAPVAAKTKALPTVAGYELLALLGKGGMGKVWKARQKSLERPVALKVLSTVLAKDPTYVERFHREALAAGALHHPNIVSVIDHGIDPASGVHYIAFELVDGVSVGQLLAKRTKLPEREALAIVRAVAQGLTCAEAAGIIHRDIKPDNIIIARDGVPRLVDLGLAKRLDEKNHLTLAGIIMGTPQYMAPEQALGAGEVDHRADLYALGLTLFKLVTGKIAFEGDSAVALLVRHLNEDCPDPRAVDPAVSEATARIVLKLAARERENRYQTAKDAIADIDRVLGGHLPELAPLPVALAPELKAPPASESPRPRVSDRTPRAAVAAGTRETPERRPSSHPRHVARRVSRLRPALAGTTLVVVTALVLAFVGKKSESPEAPVAAKEDPTELAPPAVETSSARAPALAPPRPEARDDVPPARPPVEAKEREMREATQESSAETTPAPTTASPDVKSSSGATPVAPAEPVPPANLEGARARLAALDFTGALALLDGVSSKEAEALRTGAICRRAYFDALEGAAAGARLLLADGRRVKIQHASSERVQLEDGSDFSWSALPRASVADLVAQVDRSVSASHRAAALVLYDLGLWSRGDQRVKAWVDAEPDAAAEAFALVAEARGLPHSGKDGFVFREGEWLTRDEERLRAGDLVSQDGQSVTRDEARKFVEKQRKARPPRKTQPDEARARVFHDLGVTDVKTLLSTGSPARRIDVVIVSDGFAQGEIASFEQAADSIASALPALEPFRSFARSLNVHRVTAVEETSAPKKTRLGARVGFFGALDCDAEAARKYARLAPDADLVIVCANLPEARATGHAGRPAVIAVDRTGHLPDTFQHEVGSALGGLDDEADDDGWPRGLADFGEAEESAHVNTTRQSNPELAKWHYWLRPPALSQEQRVRCFEGSYYRSKGYYRQCQECRMRSFRAHRFCPVCLEQLAKNLYQCLDPIEDAAPRAPEVLLWRDETTKLSGSALAVETSGEEATSVKTRWFLDGRPVSGKSAGLRTELALVALSPGEHQVVLRLDIHDARVRRDDGLLSASRAWRVRVLEGARPKIAAPDRVSVKRGDVVAFDVALDHDLGPLAASGPRGMSLSSGKREGRFFWAPPREARGAFRAVFSCGEGASRVERATEIAILDEAHEVGPLLADPGIQTVARGEAFSLSLSAADADQDGLVFSSRGLPAGAELDATSGALRFSPVSTASLPPEVEVPVRVSDGKLQDEITIKLRVESRALETPSGQDALAALRSPLAEARAKALAALAKSELPEDQVLLETARLLRDRDPKVAAAALEALPKLPAFASRRGLLALDLVEVVWDFDDRPQVRAFLGELAKGLLDGDSRAAAVRLQKELGLVEKYNKDRGAR
ncbi:protein kinase [bacterium]|nr:protein kinase [bacterium]